jgi:hypothetical protein
MEQMAEREKQLQKEKEDALASERERLKGEQEQAVEELQKLHAAAMAELQVRYYCSTWNTNYLNYFSSV